MQDDSESLPPPPPVSPFAFLRKPMFIVGALFLAWIFLGRAIPSLLPHRPETPNATPTAHQTPMATAPNVPESLKEKDAQIAELQRRLEEVEAKVKNAEAVAAPPPKPAEDSATAAKIYALQASLDALKQAHSVEAGDAAHVENALRKQEEELSTLKAQLADTQAQALHRLSLMAAFDTLKDAILRGESFAEPLHRMNDLAKNDAPLQELLAQFTPYAEGSAPTLAGLQNQFEAAVPQALAPDASGGLLRHLQSLIRIRKVGEQQSGSSDEAIVARAEAKLNRGDVEASLSELSALSPPATAAFTPWVGKAQAFLHLRDTLSTLQLALLQDKPTPAEPAPQPATTQ